MVAAGATPLMVMLSAGSLDRSARTRPTSCVVLTLTYVYIQIIMLTYSSFG